MNPPVVLTVAGSDSSGGAGIQADLKTIAANGGYGVCALTAVTAQSTKGVFDVSTLCPELTKSQVRVLADDLSIDAVKTGMLANEAHVLAVANVIQECFSRPTYRTIESGPPLVVDPIVHSSSGRRLLDECGLQALVTSLLPLASVVTPNADELGAMLQCSPPRTAKDAADLALRLFRSGGGPEAILITGGHFPGPSVVDVLVDRRGDQRFFESDRVDCPRPMHGTGCAFSAALATQLARGLALDESIVNAKGYMARILSALLPFGDGPRSLADHHGRGAGDRELARADVPRFHIIADSGQQPGRHSRLKLASWAAAGQVGAIQYREKRSIRTQEMIDEVAAMRRELIGTKTRLIVNDRIDIAAASDADGVHLGKDDPGPELARRLLGNEAVIGGTANNLAEAIHVAQTPVNYLGIGPVFGTRSKAVPAPTLGLSGLREICEAISLPVIAIGNITPSRVGDVLENGAWGVALLSAIGDAADPADLIAQVNEEIMRWMSV